MSVKVNIPQAQSQPGFGSFLGGAAGGAAAGSSFGPWGAVAGGVIGGMSAMNPRNESLSTLNQGVGLAGKANGFSGGGSGSWGDNVNYKPGMLGQDYNLSGSSQDPYSTNNYLGDYNLNNQTYGSQTPDDSYQAIQRRFGQRSY